MILHERITAIQNTQPYTSSGLIITISAGVNSGNPCPTNLFSILNYLTKYFDSLTAQRHISLINLEKIMQKNLTNYLTNKISNSTIQVL